MLTVIIKTFNEDAKVARAIESALRATARLDAEIVVADSLSTDATVAVASRYPVRIVQLADPGDRSCGAGAQLGFQHAAGDYIYLLDGDMALEPGFLGPALAALQADPRLAGVGGSIIEESDSMEFRLRKRRGDATMRPGAVDRLHGGGLYRRSALEDAGYFTDANLHSFEELELGLRLRSRGWRLRRIAIVAARHYGHDGPALSLLRQRWRSRYAFGPGELLRAALDAGYASLALRELRLFVLVLGWFASIFMLLAAGLIELALHWLGIAIALTVAPLPVMIARKRGLALGCYAVAAWVVLGAGLLAGLVRSRRDPRRLIPARVLR